MSTHELPDKAIKLMVDLSTTHLTAQDNALCSTFSGSDPDDLPRMVEHAYGYIVFVSSDPEATARYRTGLRESGFSPTFIDIYERAAASENPIMLINFDRDAEAVDGLPAFSW